MSRVRRPLGPVVALALGLLLGACGGDDAEPLAGIVREPLPQVGEVSLPDAGAGGEPFPFRAPEGEILVVYFGYTHCPDVCPTTLSDLRRALREMGEDAEQVEVAMATIDPARDTAEVVTEYVQSFITDAHGLRTDDDAQLRAAADAFGASYSVETVDGEVEVGHTGYLYAVDDQGRLLLTWPFGVSADDLRADLERLVDEGADATGAV